MSVSLIIFVVLSLVLVGVLVNSTKSSSNDNNSLKNKKQKHKSVDERLPAWALRALALLFACIPILSLVTGRFWENPVANVILVIFFSFQINNMLKLANSKSK